MNPRCKKSAGFSLVEAMVSLVVISVGMIGIAALYTQGLGSSRVALSRTAAVNLAARMAEDIRVNRLGQAGYNAPAANNHCDPSTAPVVDCTPAQMAQHDLWLWNRDVQQNLGPSATGTVTFTPGTPPTYTIQVAWTEAGVGAVNETLAIQVPTI
jgi:type IV pilus assembly protein PilV